MKIVINKHSDPDVPWELSFTIEGKDYSCRRIRAGELAVLMQPQNVTDSELIATVLAMFESPAPDLAHLDVLAFVELCRAIRSYALDYLSRCTPAEPLPPFATVMAVAKEYLQ